MRDILLKANYKVKPNKPSVIFTVNGEKHIIRSYQDLRKNVTVIKDRFYYKSKLVHKLDGPAFTFFDGTKNWFRRGKRHRIGGPAIIEPNGRKAWCHNGYLHRVIGPAVIHADGTVCWYQHGKAGRKDGPTMICKDGLKKWLCNHKLHRLDGPAIEYPDSKYNEYWINGVQYTEDEFKFMMFCHGSKI